VLLYRPHLLQALVHKYTAMILNELYHPHPEAYQDLSQDNSQVKLGDLRKTRLTLQQINKLRQMTDVRNYEYQQKLKLIKKQYAPPPAAAM
jgi:CRISPR/Cas system-associated endonuclease/helicase Cas3